MKLKVQKPLHRPQRAAPASPSFQKYFTGYYGGILPEDEIRQRYQITATGAIGDRIGHPVADKANEIEYERFSVLDTRALVIIPFPYALNIGVTHDPEKLAAYKAQRPVGWRRRLRYGANSLAWKLW